MKMMDVRTKVPGMQLSLLKKEASYKELCDENLGFTVPKPCLEPNISKSVVREDVSPFLKGQQRKSEGEFI